MALPFIASGLASPWPNIQRFRNATDILQSRQYNSSGYLQNGATGLPPPGAAPLLPNQGRVIQTGSVRVLCIADVRGTWPGDPFASLPSSELLLTLSSRKLEIAQ